MTNKQSFYFDLESDDFSQKMITIIPNKIIEDNKTVIKHHFGSEIQEIDSKNANDLLVKSSPENSSILMSKMDTMVNMVEIKGHAMVNSDNASSVSSVDKQGLIKIEKDDAIEEDHHRATTHKLEESPNEQESQIKAEIKTEKEFVCLENRASDNHKYSVNVIEISVKPEKESLPQANQNEFIKTESDSTHEAHLCRLSLDNSAEKEAPFSKNEKENKKLRTHSYDNDHSKNENIGTKALQPIQSLQPDRTLVCLI